MTASCLKCKIAGLNICLSLVVPENRLIKQASDYLLDFADAPDFKIEFTEDFIKKRKEEVLNLPLSEAEYIWTGYEFCRQLLSFDGFVLHASAVAYNGRAYLFSAPSGTGKSTHAALWEKVFTGDAVVINDDKPALRLVNDKIYVFGTPWSGKSDKNKNISVPLGGICFISRGKTNKIEKADIRSAVSLILGQTLKYPSRDFMETLLGFLNENLKNMPVFKMECTRDKDAAIIAYEFMNKHLKGDNFYEN